MPSRYFLFSFKIRIKHFPRKRNTSVPIMLSALFGGNHAFLNGNHGHGHQMRRLQEQADADDYFILKFNDEGQEPEPYAKYGLKLAIPLFAGVMLLSGILVCLIIKMSHCQERCTRRTEEQKQESQKEEFYGNLICKSWNVSAEDTVMAASKASTSLSRGASLACSGRSSSSSSSDSDADESDEDHDVEIGNTASGVHIIPKPSLICFDIQHKKEKDGHQCSLCSKEYDMGDQIYESNNPQCQHEFHKECIIKRVNIQNKCPICNLLYVIANKEG